VVAIFDPALYENFTIEKEWMGLWAKNTLLRVSRVGTGLVSAVLVAGSMGALVSLTPPSVAATAAAVRCATAATTTAAAAVPALALGVCAVGGVRIRQHCNPRAQFGNLFVTQLQ
jgi:hypothetical protein